MTEKIALPTIVAVMEALAAIKALAFAQDIVLSSLILEGDSKVLINTLKSEDPSLASHGHLIDEVKSLAEIFTAFSFSHIRG